MELVEQMAKELDKHPEWAVNIDITQRRFFRVDAESLNLNQSERH